MKGISIKAQSTEDRCVTGPENRLFAGESVHRSARNFTGCGGKGVKVTKKPYQEKTNSKGAVLGLSPPAAWKGVGGGGGAGDGERGVQMGMSVCVLWWVLAGGEGGGGGKVWPYQVRAGNVNDL